VSRLKGAIELELPTEGDGVTVETLEVHRGRSVSLDLVSLPVECGAPVIVWHNVDMKHEGVSPQVQIEFLGDVRTKVAVTTVWRFDRSSPQRAVDQRVGIGLAICNRDRGWRIVR